jgi:hypothetical protein
MSAILVTSSGKVACSWCGTVYEGNTWQAITVRGYFCGKSCRDTAENDLDYVECHPKGGKR